MCITFPPGTICLKLVTVIMNQAILRILVTEEILKIWGGGRQIFQMDTIFSLYYHQFPVKLSYV